MTPDVLPSRVYASQLSPACGRSVALIFWTLCLLLLTPAHAEEAAGNTETQTDTQTEDRANNNDANTEQADSSNGETTQMMPERVTPNSTRQRHGAIAEHLTLFQRQQEMVLLAEGETPFYGLFLQERSGRPQGAALILHARGEHGLWPRSAGHMRESLPDVGWSTLAIELPDPPDLPIPPTALYAPAQPLDSASSGTAEGDPDNADSASSPGNEGSANAAAGSAAADAAAASSTEATAQAAASAGNTNNAPSSTEVDPASTDMTGEPPLPERQTDPTTASEPVDPVVQEHSARLTNYETLSQQYRDAMVARIEQGVAYLKSRGQHNLVVIAYGNSAGWAGQWVTANTRVNKKGQPERGLSLVLINAMEDPSAKIPMNDHLVKLAVPVFDLVTANPGVSDYEVRQRAGLMRHKNRRTYQQFLLDAPITSGEADAAIVRRIRGWLRTHAAGTRLIRG